jgi:poly(A) polymerase
MRIFVGGCARDLLLDIGVRKTDVATSARPEQVRELFWQNSRRIIGRRFLPGPRSSGRIEVATPGKSPKEDDDGWP